MNLLKEGKWTKPLCATCKHCLSGETFNDEKRLKFECGHPKLKRTVGEVLHCVLYKNEKDD